jgi:hypothetical protein
LTVRPQHVDQHDLFGAIRFARHDRPVIAHSGAATVCVGRCGGTQTRTHVTRDREPLVMIQHDPLCAG